MPPSPAHPDKGTRSVRPGRPPASRKGGPPSVRKEGGRPPKFNEPSRPVTLTLPIRVLEGLQQIDPDRARAVVKLFQMALPPLRDPERMVDVVEMAAGKGLLLVGPGKALRRIPFLHLLEISPGRFLLALDPGHDFRTLELAVRDVLEEAGPDGTLERELLERLLRQIGKLRRSGRVSMAHVLFVTPEGRGRRPSR